MIFYVHKISFLVQATSRVANFYNIRSLFYIIIKNTSTADPAIRDIIKSVRDKVKIKIK